MRRYILFLFALLSISSAAQKMTVSGTVVSQATGKPIAGASVTAPVSREAAVVTNGDGFFTLKTRERIETVIVSFVGYETQRVRLDGQNGEALRISLKPTAIQLGEVLVTSARARELVTAAIAKIPDNYSRKPELHHCFYRETAMKRQHYIYVAEGVVDMYKTSYLRGTARDRVAIRKGRRLLSPRRADTLSIKVTGGPVTPVMLDLVKNTDILLNAAELENYDMKMEAPTSINDRRQFVVSLEPRVRMPYPLYFGKLYIDQHTLAFTRAELTLDMSDREKATQFMLVKKPAGVRFKPKELTLLIDYRSEDGVTRMSYVRTTFRFNCDWRRRLLATSFTAFCEMAITGTDDSGTDVQPIHGRESFDQRDAFFDRVDYFRDPVFWQEYNIIEPTETLDRAIDKLLKRK